MTEVSRSWPFGWFAPKTPAELEKTRLEEEKAEADQLLAEQRAHELQILRATNPPSRIWKGMAIAGIWIGCGILEFARASDPEYYIGGGWFFVFLITYLIIYKD